MIGVKERRGTAPTLCALNDSVAATGMNLAFHPLRSNCLDRLSAEDEQLLLENARVLLDTAPSRTCALLAGKNIGLLCAHNELARLFRGAAEGLGARVALIRPGLSPDSDPVVVRDTARMLARLYDAIECRDVPRELVRRLGEEADVPVYDAISSPAHPTAALARMLPHGPGDSGRLSIVQALLLSTIR